MMLSSLPPIAPRDSHTLWYTPLHPSPSQPGSSQHPSQGRPNSPTLPSSPRAQRRSAASKFSYPPTPLALLALDEASIARRKTAIRRFGYTWLRPAGLPKTMQGMEEERLEREEMEEVERRESERLNAAALGELGVGVDGEVADTTAEGERDLDAEVPDAEDDDEVRTGWEGDVVDSDEGEDFAEEDDDEPGLDQVSDDGEAAAVVDLDDDIPDAEGADTTGDEEEEGEWQHTDTDAESDSDDPDLRPTDPGVAPLTTPGNVRYMAWLRGGSRRSGGRQSDSEPQATDIWAARQWTLDHMTPEERARWSANPPNPPNPARTPSGRPASPRGARLSRRGRGRGREN